MKPSFDARGLEVDLAYSPERTRWIKAGELSSWHAGYQRDAQRRSDRPARLFAQVRLTAGLGSFPLTEPLCDPITNEGEKFKADPKAEWNSKPLRQ